MAFGPWLLSKPRYHGIPVRQPGLPRLTLNRALMSASVQTPAPHCAFDVQGSPVFVQIGAGSTSCPARLLASACEVQVFTNSEPGNVPFGGLLAWMKMVPALPSVAAVALHASGSNEDRMVMVTLLSSVAPQMSAANWKAFRRCCPSVVPGLPPTGATGVGSLKPTPAGLMLTMTMVALA